MGDARVAASLPSSQPTESFWQTSHSTNVANVQTDVLPDRANVVIIGSGISGAFAAQELLDRGHGAILVLEARGTCSGATGRNGGHLQPFIFHEQEPNIIDFELRNFQHLEAMIEKHTIPCDYRKMKGCVGFWNEQYFQEAKVALTEGQKRWPAGYASLVEVVEDAAHLAKLRLKGAVGAIVQSTAASLSPYKLITWMWENMLKLQQYSGRINLQTNTPVQSITRKKGSITWLIATPRGSVSALHIILATNGYTSHLLPQFTDIITPIQANMTALRPPPAFAGKLLDNSFGFLGVGRMDRVQSDYLVQQPLELGGHFMFGGGRVHARGHSVGVCDDSFADGDCAKYLTTQLPRMLDMEMDEETDHLVVDASWSGIIGNSRDRKPWIGGVPGMEGVFLCGGYSGHGMPNAALCGRHVARLVAASLGGCDWHEAEEGALVAKEFPEEYSITHERMKAAQASGGAHVKAQQSVLD